MPKKSIGRELRRREARYRYVFEQVNDVIFQVDRDGCWTFLNPSWEALTGHTVIDTIGRSFLEVVEDEDKDLTFQVFEQALRRETPCALREIRIRTKYGESRTVEVRARLLDEGKGPGFIGTLSDITDRKRLEQELAHQAFHDTLTGLPNRALFLDRVERSLAALSRNNRLAAVILLDLDNFKVVNDAMGHGVGDRMLIEVGNRLLTCIRPGDTVARFGGDEFALLLEDIGGIADAVAVAERIKDRLGRAVVLSGREITPSASLGVTVAGPDLGMTAIRLTSEELVRNADTAMYRAKVGGKGDYRVFSPSMTTQAIERLEIEAELRTAISNGRLMVHYQPIVHLDSGQISEVEALVRWDHPTLGALPPSKFIPIAEESGLIGQLGMFVMRKACRQRNLWARERLSAANLRVAVNVSLCQLKDPEFVDQVTSILKETGTDPCHLKIEITESVLMSDVESIVEQLKALKRLGVTIAIDDFGTGYSSMAYLLRLPIDTLKIDKVFVSRLGKTPEDDVVVRSVIAMAKSLGMTVTCEGIETAQQLAVLKSVGADCGQGFLFAKPMPATAITSHFQVDAAFTHEHFDEAV